MKKKEFRDNYKRRIHQEDFYLMPLLRIYRFVEVRERRKNLMEKFIDTFNLNKLHGSLNWFYYGKNPSQLYLASGFNTQIEKYMTDPLIPLIIPPVYDKTSIVDIQSTRYLWLRSRNFLENADRIFIIGYSLPDSDLNVRLMFKTCIKKDVKIYLINKDDTKIGIPEQKGKFAEKLNLKMKYSNLLGNEDRIDCKYVNNRDDIIFNFMSDYCQEKV